MPSILLDTNILIYTFDPRDEVRQEQAIATLIKLEEEEKGCLSTQCLSEFASVALTKLGLSADEIMDKISDWQNAFPTFNLTPLIVLEATRGVRDHKLSFYDAQIWACARLNQIPVIFTEDFQDGQTLEGIRFVNPFVGNFVIDEW